MVTVAGTVALVVAALDRLMTAPAVGAAGEGVTVPVDVLIWWTGLGLKVRVRVELTICPFCAPPLP